MALALAFPSSYREVFVVDAPTDALCGERVRLIGRILSAHGRRLRGRRNVATVRLAAPPEAARGAVVEAAFFGRSYLARQLPVGRVVAVAGQLARSPRGTWTLQAPEVQPAAEQPSKGRALEPVYPRIEGVSSSRFLRLVRAAVSKVLPDVEEQHDADFLASNSMAPLREAIVTLHAPGQDRSQLERARRRIALLEAEEIMRVVRRRRETRIRERRAWPVAVTDRIDARIRARLPFRPSPEQEACIVSLRRDLARGYPMARLLQGDVGTGKTLVAVYGALAAAAVRLKAVLLAPTQILADQHASRISGWLEGSDLPVVLLTNAVDAPQRGRARRLLAGDRPCLVVGTHALFEEGLEIAKLGLLVIDEQHRFGVEQRARLFRERDGRVPHVLVMSATPIPRTMATALYGDLDLSEIHEPPLPREPVETLSLAKGEWPRVRDRICEEIASGGRVFVVCPRIGDDRADDEDRTTSALATFHELRPHVPVVLAHGRQTADERLAAQQAFRTGQARCLVATTVVEVGVDVPEATWMVVRDAERLGVASLHQLRGRVGRGPKPGRCILLADPAAERLHVLERSNDGFEIAEADLIQRGAGELTGRLQHGHLRFRCLRPLEDVDILRLAHR